MAKQKTLLEKITSLLWWNHLPSIKEILLGLYYQSLAGAKFYEAGTNITFSGTGTPEDPILINSTGGGSGIQSIQAGTNITVNNTDPLNPIVSASGGGGSSQNLQTVTDGDGNNVTTNDIIVGDLTSENPIFSLITKDGFEQIDTGKNVKLTCTEGLLLSTNGTGNVVTIKSDNILTTYSVQMPNKTEGQTLAMTSDVGVSGKQSVIPALGVVTIPHGLGVNPSFISFNFDDTRSLEMRTYLVTTNTTNIIITFDSPPVETSATVWWSAKP